MALTPDPTSDVTGPGEMDWRTFRDEDLPGVAAVLAEALPYDRPDTPYVRYLLPEDPGFDPGLTWVAEDDRQIVGVVAGVPPDARRQAPGGVKLFGVSPAHRRRGSPAASSTWSRTPCARKA